MKNKSETEKHHSSCNYKMNELSLNILDICQNSIKANASLIEIFIIEYPKKNKMIISIKDNGLGMDKNTLRKVSSPFSTPSNDQTNGLGIPLFNLAAEQSNGCLSINSEVNEGTIITGEFDLKSPNAIPLGNMEDTIAVLILNSDVCDTYYKHSINNFNYIFDTREIKTILNINDIRDYSVINWAKQNIKAGIKKIHKEV